MNPEFVAGLRRIGPVRLEEPLARHVTFGAGGPAEAYLAARTEEQLRAAYALARTHGVPFFIFGAGSNILVGDRGIRGLVIENRTSSIDGPSPNGAGYRVRVASGVSFAALARRVSAAGYSGVEWACGIPGSLGGAVVTNAGAYGSSLADVLKSVRLADEHGEIVELTPDDLGLAYRTSTLARGGAGGRIVLSVDIRLAMGDAQELRSRVKEWDIQRKATQPPGRNCGSVFKNPADHPAWWYVDQVGLRGHRIGNAQFSDLHSNFILNLGGAKAADIRSLTGLAQARVREKFGIELETEVLMVGEF